MNKLEAQPIVCDLTAIPAPVREQHLTTARQLFQSAEEIRELSDGYTVRLPNAPGMWLALATFVEHERRCCPFWRFTLTVEPNDGPLWLALSGPADAKALLLASELLGT